MGGGPFVRPSTKHPCHLPALIMSQTSYKLGLMLSIKLAFLSVLLGRGKIRDTTPIGGAVRNEGCHGWGQRLASDDQLAWYDSAGLQSSIQGRKTVQEGS